MSDPKWTPELKARCIAAAHAARSEPETDERETVVSKKPAEGECSSCSEESCKPNECPNSRRPCGHHCNCSWEQEVCCWCGKEFDEDETTGREPEKEQKHMRTIKHHIIPEANSNRTVVVTDEPDPNAGGACHVYELGYKAHGAVMEGADPEIEASAVTTHRLLTVRFQHGPVKEFRDNGVSEAQLLAVLIDRYESFQAGPFASEYNETTLQALKVALDAQHQRTRDRANRGVEGRNQK